MCDKTAFCGINFVDFTLGVMKNVFFFVSYVAAIVFLFGIEHVMEIKTSVVFSNNWICPSTKIKCE